MIDAYVRVSLVGIELLTIDARIVIASVDTYLRFAEATNRLDLYSKGGQGLPDLIEGVVDGTGDRVARGKTRGVLEDAKEKLFGSDEDEDENDYEDDDEDQDEQEQADYDGRPRRRRRSRAES